MTPCKRGHTAGRDTSGHCKECRKLFEQSPGRRARKKKTSASHYYANWDKYSEKRAKYFKDHQERDYKKQRERLLKRKYGEFWEAHLLLMELTEKINERSKS